MNLKNPINSGLGLIREDSQQNTSVLWWGAGDKFVEPGMKD